ncbi:MAG: nickel pincer cofactor biosynthesis protein LarB [Defluviitaleaceae bacterium]|nr:nickel pincer cofactor biosynthesis protein LarB [Defluviitaleaceae bacterium]
MKKLETIDILNAVRSGEFSPEEAMLKLRMQPYEDLGYARVDHHRELRQGIAEVIYGEGKTAEQISGIASAMIDKGQETILITRMSVELAKEVMKNHTMKYHELARVGIIGEMPEPNGIGTVVVATGGTTDLPVAEEAALTAEALGNEVIRLYDVGVAGLHRLLSKMDVIMKAQVIVAVAGMEGALPSVMGGLVDVPVIAVPASIGYGASFGGLSALLTMINSCASGVCVMNIDNGFGGGYLASMINHQRRPL